MYIATPTMKRESITGNPGGRLRLFVLPLEVARNVGGKDRLEPIRWSAAANPRMGGSYRTPEACSDLSGSQSKAFVPSHGPRVIFRKKNAMRKINLASGYAMRIL